VNTPQTTFVSPSEQQFPLRIGSGELARGPRLGRHPCPDRFTAERRPSGGRRADRINAPKVHCVCKKARVRLISSSRGRSRPETRRRDVIPRGLRPGRSSLTRSTPGESARLDNIVARTGVDRYSINRRDDSSPSRQDKSKTDVPKADRRDGLFHSRTAGSVARAPSSARRGDLPSRTSRADAPRSTPTQACHYRARRATSAEAPSRCIPSASAIVAGAKTCRTMNPALYHLNRRTGDNDPGPRSHWTTFKRGPKESGIRNNLIRSHVCS
jgi:hypothetical protein